ncbi:hypothetical protein LTR84_010759 [Exophiala bonariae]|uniref:Uncharacterized protein n=1 Tax=Exophiala bonariae TaxID=1690606 RepID=A0AAV9MVX7_9EURO|nr:hypothetical protein LTR84_010759 [Exophiala bonariae]
MDATDKDAPVAVVTGAASGIGLAVTKFLVARGYRVVMADWNDELAKKESTALGDQTSVIKCDVASWDSQATMFATAIKIWGRIDVVHANAGIPDQLPLFHDNSIEPQKPKTLAIEVDLYGVIYSTSLALFYIRQNKGRGGKIIITASQAGVYPLATGPLYAAAKSGCINMMRSIAKSCAKEQIYVNCICPGLTDTGLTHNAMDQFPKNIVAPMENHIRTIETFLDTDIYGAAMESDAGGLFNRQKPDYWSPEHQAWLESDETADAWEKGGPLGSSQLGSDHR